MKKLFNLILVLSLILTLSAFVAAAEPFGASVTNISSSRTNASSPEANDALAGNVSEISITGVSITQSWQGYFGNVSGTIQLGDNLDNVMYNWSVASPEGEIYATNSSSVAWEGIQCYNQENNMTHFETMFGLAWDDVDGINETFNLNNHPEFFTNSKQFTTGLCDNTRLYDSSGVGTFNEVLLTDGSNLVFTSLLLEDANGFDNIPHDFEMMVLENGHGTDVGITTYYFWVELE
ncbi:MAG: hypothetical protein ACP5NZ_01875 [Nanobdellota archaeon]